MSESADPVAPEFANARMTMPSTPLPRGFWARLGGLWVTRSLGVGAVVTCIDLVIGTSLITLGTRTQIAAMCGSLTGSVLSFFGNRYFAFRDTSLVLTSSALRYALMAIVLSTIHGRAVSYFRDIHGVPFVPAKLLSDVAVYSVSQLVIFRLFIFPRRRPTTKVV